MNRNSYLFSCLLNCLMPGLGHAFWSEWAFGSFIFLVMVLSALLGVVSLLLSVSPWARIAMLAVPLIFYAFTFVDLRRVVRSKKSLDRHARSTALFLSVGIIWQTLSPVAPVNFGILNFPEIFVQPDNSLSPAYRQGDLMAANSLAYRARFLFVSGSQLYALPGPGEIVRFVDTSGVRRVGLMVGLSGDQVEIADDVLMVNSVPFSLAEKLGFAVSGRVELTMVDPGSIMIITIRLGAIDGVEQVPISEIVGKVHKLL